jgi:hypothetical protein
MRGRTPSGGRAASEGASSASPGAVEMLAGAAGGTASGPSDGGTGVRQPASIVACRGRPAAASHARDRARAMASSGGSSAGGGATALAPRSSQNPAAAAGMAWAGRAIAQRTSSRLVASAARRLRRSIGRILWIGDGHEGKRPAMLGAMRPGSVVPRHGARGCALLAIAALALFGCARHATQDASGDDAGGDAADDASPADDGGPVGPSLDAGDGGLQGDGPTSGCAAGADLVYAATEEKELYAFDPMTATFTLLGTIDCAGGQYVNSMALDRNAIAWINYGDGSLWKVDTHHPQPCQATGYKPGQQGITLFGMAFSAKSSGSSDETLFVDDLGGSGLGFIDLATMQLQRLGPFQGALAGRAAELNGTGDARLFGFFAGSPLGDAASASVEQIDPATQGSTRSYPLAAIDTGSDWAFAFWAGDFYLFTADKYDMTMPDTTVTRFRPSDGSLTKIADLTFRIVGAAASTCAPTTPIP